MPFTSSEVAAWSRFKYEDGMYILKTLDSSEQGSDTTGQIFMVDLAKRVPSPLAIIKGASPGSVHDSQFNRELDQTFASAMVKMTVRYVAYTSAEGARIMTDAIVKHGNQTHGQFHSFQKLVLMAPIICKADGKECGEKPWKEAQPEEILNPLWIGF